MSQVAATDPLVARAIRAVTDLAVGNDIVADEIAVLDARRLNHPVRLRMFVDIEYGCERQSFLGQSHPDNSRHFADAASAAAWLREGCNELALDPATAAELAAHGRHAPEAWFEALADDARVGTAELRCHYHELCSACGGNGHVQCGNLLNAKWSAIGYTRLECAVSCSSCAQTGRERCLNCIGGREAYTESYYDVYTQSQQSRTAYRTCQSCWGQGRSHAPCGYCQGTAVLPHAPCNGTGSVTCSGCDGHGWFTWASVGWLEAKPSRTCQPGGDVPASVMSALRAIEPSAALKQSEVEEAQVSHKPGQVAVGITASFPHVELALRLGPAGLQRFEFMGTASTVVAMPPFLDALLSKRMSGIVRSAEEGAWLDAIETARGARVTRQALVATMNGKASAEVLCIPWQGAVTPIALEGALASLRTAYNCLGTATTRRLWQFAALPLAAWAAAVPLLSLGEAVVLQLDDAGLLPGDWLLSDAAIATATGTLALMPLLIIWVAAGRIGRRRMLALTGEAARRRPAPGRWELGAVALAVLAYCGGLAAHHWPGAPPLPVRAAVGSATPLGSSARLPATSASRMAFIMEPPAGELRGTPATYRLQFALAQLGYLPGAPDGLPGPRVRDAFGRFLLTVPKEQEGRLRDGGAQGLVEAAMHDEFRLELPANAGPAAALPNFARSLVTRDDVSRIQAALERAVQAPGRPEGATSADGRRGYLVAASAVQASGCIFYELELKRDGAVERTGTRPLCRRGNSWAPG